MVIIIRFMMIHYNLYLNLALHFKVLRYHILKFEEKNKLVRNFHLYDFSK